MCLVACTNQQKEPKQAQHHLVVEPKQQKEPKQAQ